MAASRVLQWLAVLAGAVLACHSTPSSAGTDDIFGGNGANFENEFLKPATDDEAARFLTQATFGPNPAEIASLKSLGYEAWLDQQFNRSATLARPVLEQLARA